MARLSRRAFIPFHFVPVLEENEDKDRICEQNLSYLVCILSCLYGKGAWRRG